MILCVDIGNTETTFGLFENYELKNVLRIETKPRETADEVAMDLKGLLSLVQVPFSAISGVCISSVVPSVTKAYTDMFRKYFEGVRVVNVGPGVKTGIPLHYENAREIGADRIANSVGCVSYYGKPAIVVDFGTATTFDVISEKGEYLGGLIFPGIMISANALFSRAARLSQVELKAPSRLIGKNTAESIQSGIIFGTAAMVDGLVKKIKNEISGLPVVVATGGLLYLVKNICAEIDIYDPNLTLFGLLKIYEINAG